MLDSGDFLGTQKRLRESLQLYGPNGPQERIGQVLLWLAGVAVGQQQPGRAAILLGAVALNEALSLPIRSNERERYERILCASQGALDSHEWHASWDAGRAMPFAAVYQLALQELQ